MRKRMNLQDYIEKYGVESGTKRFEGMQKTLEKRELTYNKQPFKRLTREWFIWRYPDDGEERFAHHQAKSAHTLENFQRLYGQDEGRRRYEQTIAKKNTVQIVRETKGEEAVKAWYAKAANTMNSRSDDEKNLHKARLEEGRVKYAESIRGKKRIDVLIEKYGVEEGTLRYKSIMERSFPGPCRMSSPARDIFTWLVSHMGDKIDQILCDVPNSKEYWIYDKGKFYSYDFTHLQSKTILEFHGSFWHPRILTMRPHQITQKPLISMWDYDRVKKAAAVDRGFKYYEIWDYYSNNLKEEILKEFVERVI